MLANARWIKGRHAVMTCAVPGMQFGSPRELLCSILFEIISNRDHVKLFHCRSHKVSENSIS